MVYTYTPTYYSSLHDTITSLCKSILPFKIRRLPSADQKLAKRHSDNLKWQQESFHRILNLVGLHKEGIVPEADVSAFRTHLLDTLIASPAQPEPPGVIRDRLLFLQELFYAKCISAEQYHCSKRPLLQRLAVLGVEIDTRDVIVGGKPNNSEEEEWSVIDLRDKEETSDMAKSGKSKHRSPMKPIKGAMSLFSMASKGKGAKKDPLGPVDLNRDNGTILMPESSQQMPPIKEEKGKRKTFRALFQKEQREEEGAEAKLTKSNSKKQWGFDGLKKWKRGSSEDESTTESLLPGERSDDTFSVPCEVVASPIGEGPDTKRIKKKIHSDGSSSDFFIDKVLGENIKKELTRIQSELCTTNPNHGFSDDQIEAISTTLPVDKADLKKFFPKSWCERYGDVVLDVVKKEFKDHVGEMEIQRNATREKRNSYENWVAFEDKDENYHPNLFCRGQPSMNQKGTKNPFADDCFANSNPFQDVQNPFWTPRGG